MTDSMNEVVCAASQEFAVEKIAPNDFAKFVDKLKGMSPNCFMGHAPESMFGGCDLQEVKPFKILMSIKNTCRSCIYNI